MLNVTSRKKQDNMVATRKLGVVAASSPGGSVVTADERYWAFAWIATARNGDFQFGGPRGIVTDDASRTATRCFMRGLKDKIRFETSTNHCFLWRRICFTFYGPAFITDNTTGTEYPLWDETSGGYNRTMVQLLPGTAPSTTLWNQLADIIFKGVVNVDWSELMTAPVDNRRIKLKYDKVVRIRSNNEAGIMLDVKRWHPMNSTLIYNDEEQGGGKSMPYLSADQRSSMGDYYVIDLFDTGISGTGDDALSVTPQGSLYWHER